MAATPEKHTLSKALLYTFGTTILATVIFKSFNWQKSNFLSTFMKPFARIFNAESAQDSGTVVPAATPFEDKYFKEYDVWSAHQQPPPITIAEQDHRKECLENMYYSTVCEIIDDFYGDVIMLYDHATLSFAYYARTANIPYKYLETISRKYMIETNAPRDLHVDIRDEYNKAKDRNATAAATPTPATPTPVVAETDVFVKLKSYNTASNLNFHTTTNDITEKTNNYATAAGAGAGAGAAGAAGAAAAGHTNKIFREKANRYSYRGKLTDFEQHHKTFLAERRTPAAAAAPAAPAAAHESPNTSASGYADFKRQQMTAKSAL